MEKQRRQKMKYKDNMKDYNKIYNEDYIVGLQRVPDKSVDLVVTDPPLSICKGWYEEQETE